MSCPVLYLRRTRPSRHLSKNLTTDHRPPTTYSDTHRMLNVHLPDGSVRPYSQPVAVRQIAEEIGPRLAKAALAAQVDGKTVGLDYRLPSDGDIKLRILTAKDPEALNVMRHSCAHVMARAVMRLYEGVQLAFGPTIAGGF